MLKETQNNYDSTDWIKRLNKIQIKSVFDFFFFAKLVRILSRFSTSISKQNALSQQFSSLYLVQHLICDV